MRKTDRINFICIIRIVYIVDIQYKKTPIKSAK
jgi:hypothetical protein